MIEIVEMMENSLEHNHLGFFEVRQVLRYLLLGCRWGLKIEKISTVCYVVQLSDLILSELVSCN